MHEYHYKSLHYTVDPDVYKPAEDTFILAKILEEEALSGTVLEVGTGCGLLSLIAAQTADHVIATDLSPYAVSNALRNARNNLLDGIIEILRCDLVSSLRVRDSFDHLIFNPPYLPVVEGETGWLAKAWSGGRNGLAPTARFIEEAGGLLRREGALWFLISGNDQLTRVRKLGESKGLTLKPLKTATFFYEKLFAIKAEKRLPLDV